MNCSLDLIDAVDYYFYIMWEDSNKRIYPVGIFAHIDNIYYLKISQNNEARANGFIGIPSFYDTKLYKSEKTLFDFFIRRLPKDKDCTDTVYTLLKETASKTQNDSVSLKEVPKEKHALFNKILLALDNNILTDIDEYL